MTAESLANFLTAAGYHHTQSSNASLGNSLEWIFGLDSTRPFVNWLSERLQEPGLPFSLDKLHGQPIHYDGLEILTKNECEFLRTLGNTKECSVRFAPRRVRTQSLIIPKGTRIVPIELENEQVQIEVEECAYCLGFNYMCAECAFLLGVRFDGSLRNWNRQKPCITI
jgi:hypothetical protein